MNDSDLKVVYGEYVAKGYKAKELALASHGYIANDVRDIKNLYIRLGFHLRESEVNLFYKDFGFFSLADYAYANFGLDKSALSRCMKVFKRFALRQGGVRKMFIDDRYKDYSYSQLCEMVSMDDGQLWKIKPSMTVKEIRELKQQAKKKNGAGAAEVEHVIQKGSVATSQPPDPDGSDDMPDAEYQELVPGEKVATSQLSDPDPEPELQEKEPDHVQPDLPALKNNDQRKDWLRSYKDWGLWYRDDHIGVEYYKYDFDNGARLIVEVFQEECEYYGNYELEYYHLVGGPAAPRVNGMVRWTVRRAFSRIPNSETELVEFLKHLQKKSEHRHR